MLNEQLLTLVDKFLNRGYLLEACQLLCADVTYAQEIRTRSMLRTLTVTGTTLVEHDCRELLDRIMPSDAHQITDFVQTTFTVDTSCREANKYHCEVFQRFESLLYYRNVLKWQVPGFFFSPQGLSALQVCREEVERYLGNIDPSGKVPVLPTREQVTAFQRRMKINLDLVNGPQGCSDWTRVRALSKKIELLYMEECGRAGIAPYVFLMRL